MAVSCATECKKSGLSTVFRRKQQAADIVGFLSTTGIASRTQPDRTCVSGVVYIPSRPDFSRSVGKRLEEQA